MIAPLSEDVTFTAEELGLAAWMFFTEKFTVDQAKARFGDYIEDAWNRLAAKGLLSETEEPGVFTIMEAPKKRSALANQFEEFRVAYPGKKTGHETMLKVLQKKHKDWKSAIPLLLPALKREMAYRELILMRQRRGENVHLPDMANMQTWLNQRRWEMEYPDIEVIQAEHGGRYGDYIAYMKQNIPGLPYCLSFDQYETWCNKTGPFSNINSRLAERMQKSKFVDAHIQLLNQPKSVEKAGGLYQILIDSTK